MGLGLKISAYGATHLEESNIFCPCCYNLIITSGSDHGLIRHRFSLEGIVIVVECPICSTSFVPSQIVRVWDYEAWQKRLEENWGECGDPIYENLEEVSNSLRLVVQ